MKILAIRGGNLASLYGDFEVELAAEPLASSGLFAIVGHTGAGKSTLLDALCLALFDRTPRLDSRGGAKVGRADQDDGDRVSAGDVRGLLSRGRASGFAEVDFTSRDGHQWRARWQVRRARNRAEGRLQHQELLLENLDTGDRTGGKKTEVLAAIRHQVGLTFDQFRRSALLAQGDFAAFLHAGAKQRAELLEKVTGTEIYARLSQASFARAKSEREEGEDMQRQRESLGLLSVDDRQELEQHQLQAEARLDAAKQALDVAKSTTRWYRKLADLEAREGAGNQDLQATKQRWKQAAERAATLDLVRSVQPLRALVEMQEVAIGRRDEARRRVATEGDASQDARDGMTQAVTQLAAARTAQVQAQKLLTTKAPELEQATLLDHRLARLEGEAGRASQLAKETALHARQAVEKSATEDRLVAEQRRQLDLAETWLTDNPHASTLHGVWEHVQAALRDHEQASAAALAAEQGLPGLQQAATSAAAASQRAADQVTAAESRLDHCQRAVGSAEQAVPAARREKFEARRQVQQRQLDGVKGAVEILSTALRLRTEQEGAESEAATATSSQQAALEKADSTKVAQRDLAIRLDEAERTHRASQAARELAERRPDLQQGEPCPLCGSTSHPYRHDGAPADQSTAQGQRLRQLRQRETELTDQLATAREQANASAGASLRYAQQAVATAERLAARQRAWTRTRDTLGGLEGPKTELPTDPLEAGASQSVERAKAVAETALEELDRQQQEFRAREQQAGESRAARDAARQELVATGLRSRQAKEQQQQDGEELIAGERQLCEARQRSSSALDSLATSLRERPNWRRQLEADSDAFRTACERELADFRSQSAVAEQATAGLAEHQPCAAKAAAEASAAASAATEQQEDEGKLLASVAQARQERAEMLEGRPVAEVKLALAAASTKADQELDSALRIERTAQADLKAAEARQEGSRTQLRKEADLLQEVRQELAAQLAEQSLDLELLKQRLQRDLDWCDSEAAALEKIHRAVQTAESVLIERRERRREHQSTDRPEIPAAAAIAERKSITAEHLQAELEAQELRVQVRQDDQARASGEALAAKIAIQEARSRRWQTLNEIIGSNDGQKFRNFAQGLTLDALLGHANVHLGELAPRYRLDRVPGEDLELQVIDRDMGDEVRSIKSLSGGETFLASLALALGLSSLSASKTPVKSLFIDEGFGTLDSQTLEIALSALDALQASGRQVGIISHVQGLGQRIGAQVQVTKLGGGRSRVETVSGI